MSENPVCLDCGEPSWPSIECPNCAPGMCEECQGTLDELGRCQRCEAIYCPDCNCDPCQCEAA